MHAGLIPGHQDELTRCLVECDVAGIRRLWKFVAGHLPQPVTELETLATIHLARTQMDSLNFRLRAYSHAWLTERSLPSHLPDQLKPKAERMFPRIVEAVGVACYGGSDLGRTIAPLLERAQLDAVEEVYADHRTPAVPLVKTRMAEAKKKTVRQLLGRSS